MHPILVTAFALFAIIISSTAQGQTRVWVGGLFVTGHTGSQCGYVNVSSNQEYAAIFRAKIPNSSTNDEPAILGILGIETAHRFQAFDGDEDFYNAGLNGRFAGQTWYGNAKTKDYFGIYNGKIFASAGGAVKEDTEFVDVGMELQGFGGVNCEVSLIGRLTRKN